MFKTADGNKGFAAGEQGARAKNKEEGGSAGQKGWLEEVFERCLFSGDGASFGRGRASRIRARGKGVQVESWAAAGLGGFCVKVGGVNCECGEGLAGKEKPLKCPLG